MSVTPDLELMTFKGVKELLNYVNSQISDLERRVKDIEGLMSDLKVKADKYIALLQMIEEIVGKGQQLPLSTTIELTGLKIIFDPRPIDEYETLDESRKAMADRLAALTRVKDVLEIITAKLGDKAEVPIMVEFKMGIPIKIIFRSW
ncbi:hypothetical protein [Vulcanisaeta souniana]|uniref:Uncharacterized protein n=2 Tax=Vulcanisaeta souniana TaxID=164452 RepID=A0A830E2Q5_9CREN|nr:hypothetical protein [Vulcanisaeta souniana]BDR91122.1 hypothetical protein Vsou_02150 [Vulcanisaeta souniana JCM 11219]GGI80988.1 hypothetical protein GCM10007112_17230 [Vulcanisaeta souniana JCM 11219]